MEGRPGLGWREGDLEVLEKAFDLPMLLRMSSLGGCSSTRVEKTTRKRSILVEPEVYEYSFELAAHDQAGVLPTAFNWNIESFLPRRRISENWEWISIPMPLFKYRLLGGDFIEVALHGGFPFIPFIGVFNNFSRDSTALAGALPTALRIGFEGKLRMSDLIHIHVFDLYQAGFGVSEGSLHFLKGTVGLQIWDRNSIELGAKHYFASQSSPLFGNALHLYAGPRFTSFQQIHWNPYFGYSIPSKKNLSGSYPILETSISWFW